LSFALCFRAAITMLLALHVLFMYSMARGMGEHFGFDVTTTMIAALFAFAMLIPLVWAVALPELPEAITHSILPRRRWKKGRCPGCAYDMRGVIGLAHGAASAVSAEQSVRCPECGTMMREPPPPEMLQLSARTAKRFVILNLLAWLVGCTAGETLMQIDERVFRSEVEARSTAGLSDTFTRPRWWPNRNCAIGYRPDVGYFATQ
jgi:hypothetical protein